MPNLSRRALVAGALLLPAAHASARAPGDLAAAADAAYTFAVPLLEMAKVRTLAFANGQRPGVLAGRAQLVKPAQHAVTMPNNDTVYASVFVDLRKGPAVFTFPESPNRYASLQVMDFYSNNIAVVSPRAPLKAGTTLRIVGAGEAAGPGDVVSPTPWIWALARVLVDGPDDVPAALAVRDQVRLAASNEVATPPTVVPRGGDLGAELTAIHRLLVENPPRPDDVAIQGALDALGLGGDSSFNLDRFDAPARVQIAVGVERAKARARDPRTAGTFRDGWLYTNPAIGVFGQDYQLRATVASSGLASFPQQEAMYLRSDGPAGQAGFVGPGPWLLRFPEGRLPPVDAFWSATLYQPAPSGQFFLVENAIDRYSIGNRTPGLVQAPDGATEIWIAREDPGPDRYANWLPAPATGPFSIVLRAYLPKPALFDGRYTLPPIRAA